MTNKAKLIQLVHIAKSQLNMEDLSYREMLKRLTGKTSSTKCTVSELHAVLFEMQMKGSKIKWNAPARLTFKQYSPPSRESKVATEMVLKIRAIWIEMGKEGMIRDRSEQGLNRFITHTFNRSRRKKGEGLKLYQVQNLNAREAYRVLETLKSWKDREETNREAK